MTHNIIISGFGGQGILFASKQLAKSAMHEDLHVSWLPSYGPEMRGGACNCSVIISDEEIGSPLIPHPDILIVFNLPSFDKFESQVSAGGLLIVDSTLVNKKSERNDINVSYIPATGLAADNKLDGLANVIVLGHLLKKTGMFDYDSFLSFMVSSIPPAKAALIEKNTLALKIGYDYEG